MEFRRVLFRSAGAGQDKSNGCVMISQKARYALRALTALSKADPSEPMLISDIAVSQSIPKKFLEQILLDLKRAGIVCSRRGKMGGYLLLKPANAITLIRKRGV